ncbi:hypothetical protein [Streptomyces sp. NPDC048248]|uniref:hypothetical protein n=1 Tax=Streptomyces sp. NPDC048248 TaxID=3365523 RepID=UPI0037211F78
MSTDEAVSAAAPEHRLGYDHAVPTVQDIDRAELARKELAARGAEVTTSTHWWGFALHLNAQAANTAADISDLIGDVAGNILPSPFNKIVEAYCKIKAALIKAVSAGYGCRLVSPWFAPGMLIPISKAPDNDTSLWWTVFQEGKGWSDDQRFTGHTSQDNPALAALGGKLWAIHRGGGSDKSLWETHYVPAPPPNYTPSAGWSPDTSFPGHASDAGPAAAVYEGKLYVVHKGNGSNKRLWWTSRTATGTWTRDTELPHHGTDTGPALAVYGGYLYCVHKGNGDAGMWWTRFDGNSWSGDTRIPNVATSSNPALAVYTVNNRTRLYCVHKGNGDASMWYTTFDGSNWSGDTRIPNVATAAGPALAVFKNKLYAVHRGNNDQSLWYTTFNGTSWTGDTKFPGHASGAGPALIVYRDPYGTEDQLMCVHRGGGTKSTTPGDTDTTEPAAADTTPGNEPTAS